MTALFPKGSATFSSCGRFRYTLTRTLRPELPDPQNGWRLVFVMLNPSTADADLDDPTIFKCQKYGRAWNYDHLTILNLYAMRTPYPGVMWSALKVGDDIVGPENDATIARVLKEADRIVVAWGTASALTVAAARYHKARVARVRELLIPYYHFDAGVGLDAGSVMCLGTNKDGSPVHPLYQPDAAVPVAWWP